MVHNVADVNPNGAAKPISATGGHAAWVYLVATGSSIRVGGSTVSASSGVPVPTTGLMLPPAGATNTYDLGTLMVFGASGADKVSTIYGTV